MKWWFRGNRCPHERLSGIYGDSINHCGGYRMQCLDCRQLLDGPVSIVEARNAQTAAQQLRDENRQLKAENRQLKAQVDTYDDAEDDLFRALARAGEAEETLKLVRNALVNAAGCTWDDVWEDVSGCVVRVAAYSRTVAASLSEAEQYAEWFAAEARHHRRDANRWLANTQFFAAKVRDYEDGLSWGTVCLTCSRLLDHCYSADMKVEIAERKFAALRALLGDRDQHFWSDNDLVGTLISHAAVLAILDAADDTEAPSWPN